MKSIYKLTCHTHYNTLYTFVSVGLFYTSQFSIGGISIKWLAAGFMLYERKKKIIRNQHFSMVEKRGYFPHCCSDKGLTRLPLRNKSRFTWKWKNSPFKWRSNIAKTEWSNAGRNTGNYTVRYEKKILTKVKSIF